MTRKPRNRVQDNRKPQTLDQALPVFEPLENRRMFAVGGLIAGPGTLDVTFSGDGKTTLPFNAGGTEFASDVAVQSDGKTVVVGHVQINVPGFDTIRRFAIARFNVDGT